MRDIQGGIREGRGGKGAPNTAIYSPSESLRVDSIRSDLSTLDFAVRICGMSVAGTRSSGFLIAKRIRRVRERESGADRPAAQTALRTLSPPTGLGSFEHAGDESSQRW